jgi:hypothetical protein
MAVDDLGTISFVARVMGNEQIAKEARFPNETTTRNVATNVVRNVVSNTGTNMDGDRKKNMDVDTPTMSEAREHGCACGVWTGACRGT